MFCWKTSRGDTTALAKGVDYRLTYFYILVTALANFYFYHLYIPFFDVFVKKKDFFFKFKVYILKDWMDWYENLDV